jgi:undecaprenyl-diphosphatase
MYYNREQFTLMFLESVLTTDYAVHSWFNAVHTDPLTTFFSFVTIFGNWWFVIPLVAVICAYLYFIKERQFVPPFIGMLAGAEATTYIVKILVARPRALDALVTKTDFSFPSGHAMIAVALYGFLIYVGSCLIKTVWVRRFAMCVLTPLILLTGLSRLYLGVHYMSDVLAGYCIGSAALFICIRFFIPHRAGVQ